ncbi:hypothetical protein L1987_56639 [Smallanthus sonchifolius]|uniref:Uncharacterized protein n=1 Tax=Smallanthus sonchifolius TaxID=185202 RepID=A0ACB9EDM7_9ASTR|nr:hypothetical protein L1987_56639 [Smallanthus sonchifolius]
MVSVSQSKLPVINMEDLKPETESWVTTSHKVRRTLEEYGCFMAVYGGFSHQQVNKEVYDDALKPLFDLPVETKMKNTSDKPFHGYLGPFRTRPLYEAWELIMLLVMIVFKALQTSCGPLEMKISVKLCIPMQI